MTKKSTAPEPDEHRKDSATATESESVERFDNDGNPVDINGERITQEQEIQQAVGETTDFSGDLPDDNSKEA